MKVLFFSRSYSPHDRRFLEKLASSNHEIWFLPLELPQGKEYCLPAGVRRCQALAESGAAPESLVALLPRFERLLIEVEPDLIHAGPVQSCGFITALSGFHPNFVMSWGSDILITSEESETLKWITKYTLNHADVFVCDCNAVREKAGELKGAPLERVVQFPWGVDFAAFARGNEDLKLRQQLGWQDAFVVISTRSWERSYDVLVVLRAFLKAYSQDSRLRLLLLGTGSLENEINEMIASNGIQTVVHCPGMVQERELGTYFKSSDAYLSCTPSDGSSVSLLQALASGIPAIVADAPGNREWVQNDLHGWLANIGDHEHFSECLLRAAKLTRLEKVQMADRNRSVAVHRANWETNSEKLLDAYAIIERELLAAGRP